MDSKLTKRIEEIGEILASARGDQLPLMEGYLKCHHVAAWSLLQLDRAAGRKLVKSDKQIEIYKIWLERYDKAWQLAIRLSAFPSSNDWDTMAAKTGKSSETCRQVVQALKRGGMA